MKVVGNYLERNPEFALENKKLVSNVLGEIYYSYGDELVFRRKFDAAFKVIKAVFETPVQAAALCF